MAMTEAERLAERKRIDEHMNRVRNATMVANAKKRQLTPEEQAEKERKERQGLIQQTFADYTGLGRLSRILGFSKKR